MKYIFAALFSVVTSLSFAQDRGFYSEGREFLLGYLHPTATDSMGYYSANYQLFAEISSSQKAKVSVSYYDNGANQIQTHIYTVGESNSLQVRLDITKLKPVNGKGEAPEYNTCNITSDIPITVTYVSYGPGSQGSYLALPLAAWGKKYVVASYNDNAGYSTLAPWGKGLRLYTCGQFTIVGGYNGTIVKITPSCATEGGGIGVNQGPGADGTPKPYTITLNKGQSYLVKSASALFEGTDDISGTLVESDKPVALISGHQNSSPGDGSADEAVNTDSRDFLIEQMLPVEFWDNDGLYTIPMIEATGNPIDGLGENYRIFVSTDYTPSSVSVIGSGAGSQVFNPIPYTPVELANRTLPQAFSSENLGSRFSLIQYDLRSQKNYNQYGAPSMNTIVPKSGWKNTSLWKGYFYATVPSIYEKYQSNYVTIVAPAKTFDNILVSVNNGQFLSISNAMSAAKTWGTGSMPTGSGLKAVTYRVDTKNAYFAKSDIPFIAYQFSYKVGSIGNDSPNGDGDDFCGAEAHPVGMKLFNKFSTNQLSITVDTLCNGWDICATDGREEGGIRFVTLIDDPQGALYHPKNYEYKNCLLPIELDPLGLNEFSLPGDKQTQCFSVRAIHPDQDVYAPIAIYDAAGNCNIIELRMKPKSITVTPTESKGLYGKPAIGKTVCKEYVIKNLTNNTEPMEIESVSTVTPFFQLQSVVPSAPTVLKPGDSLVATVCFSSTDEMNHIDRLTVKAGCNTLQIPLVAQSFTPIIAAKDLLFGTIDNGIKSCKEVEVRNTGVVDFSITGVELQSNQHFTLDQTSIPPFPWLIPAEGSKKIRICYTSEESVIDTAIIIWQTDISAPFSPENKDRSVIIAQGQGKTGVSDMPRLTTFDVSIFPQPARDNFTVEVSLQEAEPITITVYDILGKSVLHRSATGASGISRYLFQAKELPAGTYTVIIRTAGESVIKRVVLE